ncbi:hypothetical protein CEXT_209691 [Caerostris extrusa]|uniref:Uncharacterized protein n=1 Tax=Caerostris extrusa TaxID=172846 RepID=A0AAV4PIR1_CAEEX|nr:hypothetical protein CEXT_209691 [Caerostris extrusa]
MSVRQSTNKMTDCEKNKDIDFTEGIQALLNIARDLDDIFKRIKSMSFLNKEKVRDKFREMDKLFIAQSKEIVELKAELKLTRGKCVVVDATYDTNATDLQIVKLEGKLEVSRTMLEKSNRRQ